MAQKSWDIQPRKKVEAPPQPSPVRTRVEAPRPTPKKPASRPKSRREERGPREPLAVRRKRARNAFLITLCIIAFVTVCVVFWILWQPWLRIADVTVEGPHAEDARGRTIAALSGTHALVLPRNSLFFIPENDIRERLLTMYPDVEAISIDTEGLTTLTLTLHPRSEAFLWCAPAAEAAPLTCFRTSITGLVFAPVTELAATSSRPLLVQGPLVDNPSSPIGATMLHAPHLPGLLRFVRAMQSLGADVESVSLREDEADLYTSGGTRITYVLGREDEAAGTAASVISQLSLNDGSILYLDLRFPDKAYFKRVGE